MRFVASTEIQQENRRLPRTTLFASVAISENQWFQASLRVSAFQNVPLMPALHIEP